MQCGRLAELAPKRLQSFGVLENGIGGGTPRRENIRKAFCNFDWRIAFSSSAKRMLHHMQAEAFDSFQIDLR